MRYAVLVDAILRRAVCSAFRSAHPAPTEAADEDRDSRSQDARAHDALSRALGVISVSVQNRNPESKNSLATTT